jgi:hypothetical protein
VIVTELGCGAVIGAVYVAVFASGVPPAACVVVTFNAPQPLPVQPLPLNAHERVRLGFDPATGVSVAISVLVDPVPNVVGAESCSVKWLVIVSVAVLCFVGSAILAAVSVTTAEAGNSCGAV